MTISSITIYVSQSVITGETGTRIQQRLLTIHKNLLVNDYFSKKVKTKNVLAQYAKLSPFFPQ